MAREALTRRWSDDEITELKRLLLQGCSYSRMAVRLRRSSRAIERTLHQLGLPSPVALKRQEQERKREVH